MEFNIADVVQKYIALRDEKASVAERHKSEMAPFNEKMEVIETVLLREMEKMGVDSLKTPAGTPYKAVSKSLKLVDPESFKVFALQPVVDALEKLPNMPDIRALLIAGIRWDIIDFRPLKSGVEQSLQDGEKLPPGITMDSFTKINIRRS